MAKRGQEELEFPELKNIWDNWSDSVFHVLNNPNKKDRIVCFSDLISSLSCELGVTEQKMRILMFEAASHSKLGGGEPLSSFIAKLNMELEIIENRRSDAR